MSEESWRDRHLLDGDERDEKHTGDDLHSVLRGIYAELRAANEPHLRKPAEATTAAERRRLVARRGGSRFVAPGATDDVLDTLAGGGEICVEAPVRRGFHEPRRSLGGVMGKALAEATPSAGGYLVPSEISEEVLQLLRARSAVMRLGPRVVPVKKDLAVTSLSSGATAYYIAENAPIPVSEPTFAQIPLLAPRELAALVPVSNRLLRDADESPAVDQVLREDLAEIMALRQDLAFIEGTGLSGEPRGIVNTPGLTPGPDLGPDGRAPTFDDLKDMVATLRTQNAPFQRPGWLFHPRALSTIEKLKDGIGRYLADAGMLTYSVTGAGGTLLGFPFVTTTQIPTGLTTGTSTDTSYVIFSSDWIEAWVGENETLTIEASDEATYTVDGDTYISAWQNRQTVFRAVMAHDFALRRPALFTVMTGVRP